MLVNMFCMLITPLSRKCKTVTFAIEKKTKCCEEEGLRYL